MAVLVLADGRVAILGGASRRVLLWDPTQPRAFPLEIGLQDHKMEAMAVLPDGRIVTSGGGIQRKLLVWELAQPEAVPLEIGDAEERGPMVVLSDGRVVTCHERSPGKVLLWDPARPGTPPVELGHHDPGVAAITVLSDGWVATSGSDGRVVLRSVNRSSPDTVLACSAQALTSSTSSGGILLSIGHLFGAISCWEVGTSTLHPPETQTERDQTRGAPQSPLAGGLT